MVDEPQGEIYGGVVAAPAFRDITAFALPYLRIPPDEPVSSPPAEAPPPPAASQAGQAIAAASPGGGRGNGL